MTSIHLLSFVRKKRNPLNFLLSPHFPPSRGRWKGDLFPSIEALEEEKLNGMVI
jgi:hypothetical protein